MISMSGNMHVWSKTYRKFYYGIVFIANEWRHIRIKNKVTACHDWHEWNILLPLLILCSHICNLSTKIEYICGYENNTIIKFPICFTSHMHITGHGYHSLVIPNIYTDGWLMVINPLSTIFQSYRTVVHLNIKLFVAFLYISFCNRVNHHKPAIGVNIWNH
jgi:hypothetical protein